MFNIRREQGRLEEVEPSVRRFIELYPALVAWRAALALLLVELGRMDEARAEFEALAAAGFDDLPRDANWLIGVTLLAEVCGALGDGERAEALYALLEPYAGRNVVVGRAATCNGAAVAAAGHPRRRDALVGARGGPLHQRARDARADGRAAVGRPHASSPTPRCCSRAASAATRRAPASCSPTPW